MIRDLGHEAKVVFTKIRELREACVFAKTNLGVDYGALISLPGRIVSFAALAAELNAESPPITGQILGPIAVTQFHHDPARTWENFYQSQYDAFKVAAFNLLAFIKTLSLSHTFDQATGNTLYNLHPEQSVIDTLHGLLNAVIACDFT
jgi:hypothetical protein